MGSMGSFANRDKGEQGEPSGWPRPGSLPGRGVSKNQTQTTRKLLQFNHFWGITSQHWVRCLESVKAKGFRLPGHFFKLELWLHLDTKPLQKLTLAPLANLLMLPWWPITREWLHQSRGAKLQLLLQQDSETKPDTQKQGEEPHTSCSQASGRTSQTDVLPSHLWVFEQGEQVSEKVLIKFV